MKSVKEIFRAYQEESNLENLERDLAAAKKSLGNEFFQETQVYLDRFFDFLIKNESDRINFFLSSVNENRTVLIEKTDQSQVNFSEVALILEEIFKEKTVNVNLSTKELEFKNAEMGKILLKLYSLQVDFSNIESSLDFLKELGEPFAEVYFHLQGDRIVLGKEEKISGRQKGVIASILDSLSKFDVSAETIGKGVAATFVAASLFSSSANAGAKDVNEYVNQSDMNKSDYYVKMFFENKKNLPIEQGSEMQALLNKLDFKPSISLIKNNYNNKSNSGEFTIKVGDCKTSGYYSSSGPIEFRTMPGAENKECYELTKGFESLLSAKFNVILKIRN